MGPRGPGDGLTSLAFAAMVLARVPETRPRGDTGAGEPVWRGLSVAFRQGGTAAATS